MPQIFSIEADVEDGSALTSEKFVTIFLLKFRYLSTIHLGYSTGYTVQMPNVKQWNATAVTRAVFGQSKLLDFPRLMRLFCSQIMYF